MLYCDVMWQEYNKLVVKATASEPSVDKWLSIGVMEKSIRKVLEDSKVSHHQLSWKFGTHTCESKCYSVVWSVLVLLF